MHSPISRWLPARRREPVRGRQHCTSWRPALEALEDRTAPATLTVTSLADTLVDDGQVTLREAITAANTDTTVDGVTGAGADVIQFAPGLNGTINLTGALPDLVGNLQIQGPGADLLTVRRDSGGDYRIFRVNAGATISLTGLTIANGRLTGANQGAGVVVVGGGALTVSACRVTGNVANNVGGGILSNGTLELRDSTIDGNSASSGAGLYNGGTLTVTNTTLSGNSAGSLGGGFVNTGNGTANLTSVTITGNRATQGGGVYVAVGGTVTLHNTIVAGNTRHDGTTRDDVNGALVNTGSFNLIGDVTGMTGLTIANSNLLGHSLNPIDPLLGPLQDNGGPTPTHALLATSLAVDKGKNVGSAASDQRGFARTANLSTVTNASGGDGADIGAVEGRRFLVNSTADTDDGNPANATTTLREAMVAAEAAADADVVNFLPTVTTITLSAALPQITRDVILRGDDAGFLKISGAKQFQVFHIADGANVLLAAMTIANGLGSSGGAIRNEGTLTIVNTAVVDSVGSQGGGIYSSNTLIVTNSTISGNTASFQGGGIHITDHIGSNATLTNVTITNNVADSGGNSSGSPRGGGIESNTTSLVRLNNTIVAGNFRGRAGIRDDVNDTIAGSFNLIGDGSGTNGIANGLFGNQIGSASRPIDPQLGSLKNNGGPAPTHALLHSSPALDAGSNAFAAPFAADQRGLPRIGDGSTTVDLGAFERQNFIVTTTADETNAANGQTSLREAVALANARPGADGILFDVTGTITLGAGEIVIDDDLAIQGPGAANLTVSGNNASRVFAVNSGKAVGLIDLTIANGRVVGADGGAVRNSGPLTVVRSVITGSTAESGGGIYANFSELILVDSTVWGNTATDDGGGIYARGPFTARNSTISGNSAQGDGGGVYLDSPAATLVNVTVAANLADADNNGGQGGGLFVRTGSAPTTLLNTISAGNSRRTDASAAADDFVGKAESAGSFNNLIGKTGTTSGLSSSSNENQVSVFTPIDARLGPLQDNGGPTPTHALLPGSPAIDRGSTLAAGLAGLSADQRGLARFVDSADAGSATTADIGAFEATVDVEDIADHTTDEDVPLEIVFAIGFQQSQGVVSVAATSSNQTLVPDASLNVTTVSSTSRRLAITPAPDQFGQATITVTVTQAGQTMQDTFALTVSEVNDAPTGARDTLAGVDEDSGARVIPFADLLGNDVKGPANENGQTLTIIGVGDANGGTAALDGANVIFTPAADYNGPASFVYTLQDDGATNGTADPKTSTATAAFTINPVNDAPVNIVPAAQTTRVNRPLVFTGFGASRSPTWTLATASSPSRCASTGGISSSVRLPGWHRWSATANRASP
ncbi:MAG: Ig-like domain-containing protein [Gemmataceae bacterium]|nr:Ig-like domain-containing protein [Gemmataceae bacterium]